jgi:hypothetical protein
VPLRSFIPENAYEEARDTESLRRDMESLQREHVDDPDGLHRALMAYYEEHSFPVVWRRPIVAILLGTLIQVPDPRSPLKQTPLDRIADTAFLEER